MGQVLPDGSELCAFGKPLPHDHEGPDDHCVWVPDDVAWARSQEAEWADAARRAADGPPRRHTWISNSAFTAITGIRRVCLDCGKPPGSAERYCPGRK